MGFFRTFWNSKSNDKSQDWWKQAADPGGSLPTKKADGTEREDVTPRAGISESQLAAEEAKGEGDVYKPKDLLAGKDKETREKKAMKMAEGRLDGTPPEQVKEEPAKSVKPRRAIMQEEADASDVTPITDQTEAIDAAPTASGYEDILNYLKASQMNEAEAQRRQRRREMWASIGDGISAISSLYNTAKGGVPTYNPDKDMSTEMQKRGERMAKERAAMSDQYLAYLKAQRDAEVARENAEYRRDMMKYRIDDMERKKEDAKNLEERKARADRLKQMEYERRISNTPGGKAYFDARNQAYADGFDEKDAEEIGLAALAEYNSTHGTNYTVVDKKDNSGRVTRTVTVKTTDAPTAAQAESASNSNVENTPPPAKTSSKKSGKGKSSSKNNTPPGRRGGGGNNNKRPSRR